jgi:hypothetical protein
MGYPRGMAAQRARRVIDRSGPVRLEDLDLTDEQLAAIGVSDAQRAVRGLEEIGRDPRPALRRLAEGDPDLVAAFVAKHSSARSDVAS